MPQARGTATYNRYCTGGGAAAPAGPTAEELEKRRQAKDTREATDDAEDRGVDLYEKGQWADAVKAFQEALDYDPDNDVAATNLRKAQDKLQQAEAVLQTARDLRTAAAKQAVNAQTSSVSASGKCNEPASANAGKTFDVGDNTKNNGIAVSAGSNGHQDPVVPPARRTAAITQLEQQRATDRKQRAALEEKLKAIDPRKDPVAASSLKQQESKIDSHINYINFSIGDQLKAPSQVPPATTK
jgi:tetratricopeptide (TPR) repeat protein